MDWNVCVCLPVYGSTYSSPPVPILTPAVFFSINLTTSSMYVNGRSLLCKNRWAALYGFSKSNLSVQVFNNTNQNESYQRHCTAVWVVVLHLGYRHRTHNRIPSLGIVVYDLIQQHRRRHQSFAMCGWRCPTRISFIHKLSFFQVLSTVLLAWCASTRSPFLTILTSPDFLPLIRDNGCNWQS